MNKQQNSSMSGMALNRRSFLTTLGVATTAGLLGLAQGGDLVYADALSKAQREKMTPDEIIANMKIGNERFRAGPTRACSPSSIAARMRLGSRPSPTPST